MAAAAQEGGRLPADFVRLVRERTDLVALVAERVELRPAGRELVGLCPFHSEKTGSFYVNREKQVYHCHGCGAGGDAVTFVMRTQGLAFNDAVAELAARAGLRLPEARPLSPGQRRRLAEREELLAACEAAAAFYRDCLRTVRGGAAIAYLRRRGVDGPTAEHFGLGYAPAEWSALTSALQRRFPPEVLVRAGLAVPREGTRPDPLMPDGPERAGRALRPQNEQEVTADQGAAGPSLVAHGVYDRFRGRLMFPIWDERGRVIAFGGRALDPAERAKYLNSPETPLFSKRRALYALHLARAAAERAGRMLVVEGYMDALACHQFGFAETVATLGTALSPEQAGTLARCTECVLLAYDADAAGDAATLRGLELLQRAGARVEIVRLPPGQDPDAWLHSEGREALHRALRQPEPLVPYVLRSVLGGEAAGTLSPERRWAAARRVLPHVAHLPAGVRLEYTEWVARELLLAPDALARELDALTEKRGEHRNRNRWNARPARPAAPEQGTGSGPGGACRRGGPASGVPALERVLRRTLPRLSIHEFRDPAHQALVRRLLTLVGTPTGAPASSDPGTHGLREDDSQGGGGFTGGWGAGGEWEGARDPDAGPEGSTGARPATGAPGAGGSPCPGDRLLDEADDPELRALVVRLLAREEPGGLEALVEQSLLILRCAALRRERQELRDAQRRLEAEGRGLDAPEVRGLLERLSLVARLLATAQVQLAELTAGRASASPARERDD